MKEINVEEIDWINGYMEGAEGWYQTKEGYKCHFVNGYLHSVNDGPAVIMHNGEERWYIKDKKLTKEEYIDWQINNNKQILSKSLPYSNNSKKLKV